MGQFKPMVKMYTTEPSVELKLRKGGHVNMKKGGHAKAEKETGHKSMKHMMDGGVMGALASTPALVGRPAVNAPVRTPGKPPMAMRRKAMMPVRPAAGMMKEGGDADKAQDKAMIKKAFKMHDKQEHKGEHTDLSKLKRGGKMKKHASGGEIDAFETKTTIKGNAKKFAETEMHGTPKGKTKGKTGVVKEGNAGGYKRGGKVHHKAVGESIPDEMNWGSYQTTKVHEAGPQREKGPTGGVKEEQGGYKRGGSTRKYAKGGKVGRYVTDNVVGTPPGVTNRTTGGVREGNAGGFKKGGHSKKAFATGGKVDSGHPVAMPQGRKPASKPVSNDRQSGTFKRGGRVRMADGGQPFSPEDVRRITMGEGALSDYERDAFRRFVESGSVNPDMSKFRDAMIKRGRSQRDLDRWLRGQGAVTETERSVTVSPGKKRGGMC